MTRVPSIHRENERRVSVSYTYTCYLAISRFAAKPKPSSFRISRGKVRSNFQSKERIFFTIDIREPRYSFCLLSIESTIQFHSRDRQVAINKAVGNFKLVRRLGRVRWTRSILVAFGVLAEGSGPGTCPPDASGPISAGEKNARLLVDKYYDSLPYQPARQEGIVEK